MAPGSEVTFHQTRIRSGSSVFADSRFPRDRRPTTPARCLSSCRALARAATIMEVHPPPSSPAELLDRARRGDLSALSQLFERSRHEFVRAVRTITGSGRGTGFEPEDVFQESVLAAMRSIRDLRAGDLRGFRAWFLAIARHRTLVFRKRQRVRVRPRRATALPASHVALLDPSELETSAAGEQAAAPEAASSKRSRRWRPDQRVAVLLHGVFEARWDTVAFVLDRATSEAARQVHQRARHVARG